jgi:hypothetical protein
MSDQCEPAELSAAKERAWRRATKSATGTVAAEVSGYGYRIAGRASRPHRHPGIAYKVIWIDA